MKSARITGIAAACFASVLMMSMALASTASAHWLQCLNNTSTTTKYTSNTCSTASASGTWSWSEVTSTEEVRIKGSLKLTDKKVPIVGKVAVECYGEGVGDIGPGQHARIQTITTLSCRNVENCEKVEALASARNLPWQAEVTSETAAEPEQVLTGTTAGKEPGWVLKCKVLGVVEEDECVSEEGKPESLKLTNKATGTELLVLAKFQELRTAKCKVGGKESGVVSGSIAILKLGGVGLRVN